MQKTKSRQKEILMKQNKVSGLVLPDFKNYYKAAVIKTRRYYRKNK